LDLCLTQDCPDRARCDSDAESEQLALDPPIAPTRVLTREPHDELTHLARRWRAALTTRRMRPAPRDQLSVPAQKRRRRHEARRPCPSRQRAAEGRQESSIIGTKLRTSHLPAQHLQLVTQHQDLDLLLTLRPRRQH